MRADLHCHTYHSDGSFSVQELVAAARAAGLSAVALTDHDNMASAKQAEHLSTPDCRVVGGLELSTWDTRRQRNVHLLCYLPDLDGSTALAELCREISNRRNTAGRQMLERIAADYPIDPDRALFYAAHSSALFKQHIMHAMMDAGLTDRIYGPLRRTLFASGSPYRIGITYPSVEEGLAAIKAAHGIAVLAHPYEYDSLELMTEIADSLDGIEAYHPSASPKQREELAKWGREQGLLITGGSDFHGMYNSRVPNPLGAVLSPSQTAEKLLQIKAGF